MKNPEKSDDINGIIIDLNNNNELNYKTNTTIKSEFSINLLKKMNFEWPDINYEYLNKYFNYLKNIGFIDY